MSHDAKIKQDDVRQKEVEGLGISFIRFSDSDIKQNLDSVIREIVIFIDEKEKQPPAHQNVSTPFIKGESRS